MALPFLFVECYSSLKKCHSQVLIFANTSVKCLHMCNKIKIPHKEWNHFYFLFTDTSVFKIAKTVSSHDSKSNNTLFKLTVFFSSIKHRFCHVTVPFQLHLTHCCSNKDSQCWRRSWSFSPRCWGISWVQRLGLFAPHKPRPRPTHGECLQMTCSLKKLAINKLTLFFSAVSPAEAIWNLF